MNKLQIPEPFSGGIFLSYKCTSECRHCMYACSPKWKDDWISITDLRKVLGQLASKINKKYPPTYKRIGVNTGLHFTGGEPFLNFDLLLEATKLGSELKIPGKFVETNCNWCIKDEDTKEKLIKLKKAGLHGLLISVNPFILEYVPFKRTERAVKIGKDIFGENLIIYQEAFYHQFKQLNLKNTVPFDEYFQRVGPLSLRYIELIPIGRVPYKLGHLYRRYPAKLFFGESCKEELTREWHVHVDNYCNYITGYCGGISLGDARRLDSICNAGVNLEDHLIIKALISDLKKLYVFATEEYNYQEPSKGYISKCHLCVDIRRHLIQRTNEFNELKPKEFYYRL